MLLICWLIIFIEIWNYKQPIPISNLILWGKAKNQPASRAKECLIVEEMVSEDKKLSYKFEKIFIKNFSNLALLNLLQKFTIFFEKQSAGTQSLITSTSITLNSNGNFPTVKKTNKNIPSVIFMDFSIL